MAILFPPYVFCMSKLYYAFLYYRLVVHKNLYYSKLSENGVTTESACQIKKQNSGDMTKN